MKSIREIFDGAPLNADRFAYIEREWAARDAALLEAAADRAVEVLNKLIWTWRDVRYAILSKPPTFVEGQLVRATDDIGGLAVWRRTTHPTTYEPVLTVDGKRLIVRPDGRVEVSDGD